MKKLLLVFALSLTAVCAMAQNLSSLSKAARMAYEYLDKEGYKPYIDEDGDVSFKVQGTLFYVDNDKDDTTLLRMIAPGVYKIDTDNVVEEYTALSACNDFNRTKKLIRAAISSSGSVSFIADTYVGEGKNDMTEFLETAIDFMTRGFASWRELFNEYDAD